ncbi:MAG: hypothetical protein R3E86_06315 [Pseudomonadales bacterium]
MSNPDRPERRKGPSDRRGGSDRRDPERVAGDVTPRRNPERPDRRRKPGAG